MSSYSNIYNYFFRVSILYTNVHYIQFFFNSYICCNSTIVKEGRVVTMVLILLYTVGGVSGHSGANVLKIAVLASKEGQGHAIPLSKFFGRREELRTE